MPARTISIRATMPCGGRRASMWAGVSGTRSTTSGATIPIPSTAASWTLPAAEILLLHVLRAAACAAQSGVDCRKRPDGLHRPCHDPLLAGRRDGLQQLRRGAPDLLQDGEPRVYRKSPEAGGMPSPVILFEGVFDVMRDKELSREGRQGDS